MKSRIRTLVLLAAAVSLLSALAATPADAGWWPKPAWLQASQAPSVRAQLAAGLAAGRDPAPMDSFSYAVTDRSAAPLGACGARHITIHLSFGTSCVHSSADLAPAADAARAVPVTSGPPAVAPKCIGNGVNGARVQPIYAYLEQRGNRAATVVPEITRSLVPHVEGAFRSTSKDEGREVGVRWLTPNCKLQVDVVAISRDVDTSDEGPGDFYTNVVQALYDAGYQDGNKRYLVWLDAGSRYSCGTGALLPVDAPGPLHPDNGDAAGVGANKVAGLVGLHAQFAVVFGQRCWGGAFVAATHELLHTLGAVQTSSPNSNGAGHCTDDNDIMCYPDPKAPTNLQNTRVRCQTPVAQLDCGMDDYFAVSPPVGSYLSTHWNVATSAFLGDAIGIDAIPAALPRP